MIEEASNKNAKQIRLIAIQVAYAQTIHESLNNTLANHDAILSQHDPKNILRATNLISYYAANKKQIDQKISSHLSELWPMHRLNLVALSVLRIAATEIAMLGDYTQKLVNSYLSIAEILLEKEEVRFINAIISKIALNHSNHDTENVTLPITIPA